VTRRLVLLDRDGTINVERNYVCRVEDLELLPNAAAGVRRLNELGLAVVVVTNQSAIGRGLLTPGGLGEIHARLTGLLAAEGARLDGIYICPHAPAEGCRCRKPGLELVERAAADFGADLSRSFFIGDKRADVEAGRAAGAASILVRTGYGSTETFDPDAGPDATADDLLAAAAWIERRIADGG
jgi:D-glycero-D-manno-heptose 1,7-bisphosphate phosphatase